MKMHRFFIIILLILASLLAIYFQFFFEKKEKRIVVSDNSQNLFKDLVEEGDEKKEKYIADLSPELRDYFRRQIIANADSSKKEDILSAFPGIVEKDFKNLPSFLQSQNDFDILLENILERKELEPKNGEHIDALLLDLARKNDDPYTEEAMNIEENMEIFSPNFENGGMIPKKYTCEGEKISPELVFTNIPEGTKSLVLLMWDPDVPLEFGTNGNWDHWIVFNMSPKNTKILEGEEPKGVHGLTTSNTLQYVPPCPPDREHRYFFQLYALNSLLDLPEGATREEVENAMVGHILAEAELMGRYEKEKKDSQE